MYHIATDGSKWIFDKYNRIWKGMGFEMQKRFSERQKNFLVQKFDMGEKSGMKCDPVGVSAEMRTV